MLSSTVSTVKDETIPEGKWEFDGEVAAAFDDMLERSIPQYEVMRQACHAIARKYVKPKTAHLMCKSWCFLLRLNLTCSNSFTQSFNHVLNYSIQFLNVQRFTQFNMELLWMPD